MSPFVQGFGIGGSLIVAIGAQNAFVLSQGVRRNYPLTIALICGCCDSILIFAGVTGVGSFVAANPMFRDLTVWGGVLFLAWYGAASLRSALKGGSLSADSAEVPTWRGVVAATLAVTLLNPHAYLDTLILIGGISGQFQGGARFLFGGGAMTASFLWFFALSFGAGYLAPVFQRKQAWRILDSVVCATMWFIAASLIIQQRGLIS